jgi:serine/threonine-protein kinase RsbW
MDAIDRSGLADTSLVDSGPIDDLPVGPTLCRARPAGEGTRTIRLPHAVASVPDSREVLVADLMARRLNPTVIDEAEMVVSELVSNAVRHAKGLADGCVRIRWKVKGGAVEIEVSDGGGPTVPKPSPPSPWAVGGRGLRIVRSLAHEWGVQEDRHGRTVWAAVGGPSRRRRL